MVQWIAVATAAAVVTAAAASPVIDNVNGNGFPPYLAFTPNNAGWVYQPTFSYVLDGIYSTFRNIDGVSTQGPVAPRTVTLSVYDTNAQGALLARTTFYADGFGGNWGGNFPPVLLVAGHKYFIAYDNIYNIGLNITNWIPAQDPGTVNLQGWYTGTNFSTYIPQVDNGVLQVFSAPILRFTGTSVASNTLSSSNCLFNWAEANYPSLFAPAGGASLVYLGYYYRYYAATRSYVGVSGLDNNVYYIGPDGALRNVGALAGWLATAGCPPAQ
jgi:hypothetical protein